MIRSLLALALVMTGSVAMADELEIARSQTLKCKFTTDGVDFTAKLATGYQRDEWGDKKLGEFLVIEDFVVFKLNSLGGCLSLSCPKGYEGVSPEVGTVSLTVWPEGERGTSGKQAEGNLGGSQPFTCDVEATERESRGGAASL